jgi:nucleoside-diphosphate-sugar epimerase
MVLDQRTSVETGGNGYIVNPEETLLVTGANGFIGSRVVRSLLTHGFKRVRCFTRSTGNAKSLEALAEEFSFANVEIVKGNLLSRDNCLAAARGVSVVYHLAAGIDKTFPGCFLNSVVTTRNLLDALMMEQTLKRFVNVSSLAVYSNEKIRAGGLMDESCEMDTELVERHDPYAYGKAKQDELVLEYAKTKGLPWVVVRPGVVFGPGKAKIPGRVGIDTFGVFLHLGLNNRMPFTYVDNCAEAIVLAGLRKGIEGEVINIVDDNLPKSREFLRMYKKRVRRFLSIPLPYTVFYLFNYLWERYSKWSEGQLPPAFNRRTCAAYFKGNTYSNKKAKEVLGWHPRVGMSEGMERYFAYAREVITQSMK